MSTTYIHRRREAQNIWWAGVQAVQPDRCLPAGLRTAGTDLTFLQRFDRVLVLGGGKANAAMAQVLEQLLEAQRFPPERVYGVVNVPNEAVIPLKAIRLHAARPMGVNYPTREAKQGTEEMLRLAEQAGPNELLICLISGGGSALLPAPVPGITLEDKQQVTKLLHECGATIQELNAVRKHLSRIKGGGLVRHFRGREVLSLIISDVIGDPLDVIASGPTAVDNSTFLDAIHVLEKYELLTAVPPTVRRYLERGCEGAEPETLKHLPRAADGSERVRNLIVASNSLALDASLAVANTAGYRCINLGADIAGDTTGAAIHHAQQATRARSPDPVCLLSGGETTVVLPPQHGKGGRNQEFVLAFLNALGTEGMKGITVLSGGTDGEDGPTNAAGAIGDAELLLQAAAQGLKPADYLARHDAYHFFEPLGGLLKTRLTRTNVMDLRVILIHPSDE
jgi:hydroxypyruvate reductase/glycerate 2-kinase